MSSEIKVLRRVYDRLEACAAALLKALRAAGFSVRMGFYNGHYRKDDSGEYVRHSYPIPELEVLHLCDVEIDLDGIYVSAQLPRERALALDPAFLCGMDFSAYGVQNYTSDYWTPGMSFEAFQENIRQSGEEHIGYTFCVRQAEVVPLVQALSRHGFHQTHQP